MTWSAQCTFHGNREASSAKKCPSIPLDWTEPRATTLQQSELRAYWEAHHIEGLFLAMLPLSPPPITLTFRALSEILIMNKR